MDINTQIERLKSQKPVEVHTEDELLQIFSAASYLFRRHISPIMPAQQLEKNLKKILLLCRLENNEKAYALVLRARAAAQLDSNITPSKWDDINRATGMDILKNSSNAIVDGDFPKGIKTGVSSEKGKGFVLTFGSKIITIKGGAKTGEATTKNFVEACNIIDELNVRIAGGQKNITISYGPAEKVQNAEIFDTVHDPWLPTTVYSKRLKPHPTPIIEPSTLVATSNPKPTYQPLLPVEAIERGFISDAQFETVVYALQSITQYLPGSPLGVAGPKMKAGYIIGDGTGVGKTNEFCAVTMDQKLRGRKRHIFVVERSKHVEHIRKAWQMIGGNPKEIMFQGDRNAGDELPSRNGIMITTYALIRDEKRYRSLINWANDQDIMDGVLVFDEAHNMRNAIEDKHDEGSGRRNRSQQGMAGVNLQNDLPNAGVIYASATMATDVYNLGYASRLGLWGENAPFSNPEDFINQMYNLDEAALEQICIDLKSAGRYCSRTLSFEGVEYDEIEHRLTPHQRERFNQTVGAWKNYSKMRLAAMRFCTGKNDREFEKIEKAQRINNQRYVVERLLTQFNVESMIEDMHEELAKGNCPVVQIAMTGEAMMKRIIGDKKILEIEEYQERSLYRYIDENFPIHYMVKAGAGWFPKLDDNNNPIVCDKALELKKQALKMSEEIALTMNAMDRIYLEFGVDQVAEMTGRSSRVVPILRNGKLSQWKVEDRNSANAVADVEAFQNGKKSILMFSLAAGGSGLSYHAGYDVPNKRRRVHYILEMGRRSETAVQGIGRTHRSGQVIPPFVKMVTSDIPAHAIYASKTLAKIAKMGALSRGHQHATTNAIFEQSIPLHTVYAERGWKKLIEAIRNEEVEGFEITQLLEDLGLEKANDFDVVMTRLALMTDGDQRQLVKELKRRTEEEIATAIRNGEYNQGLETISAKSIQIVDENIIDNANGSNTYYYRLQKHEEINKITFSKAMMMFTRSNGKRNSRNIFMKHKVNGRIALGIMQNTNSAFVDITTPAGTVTRTANAIRQEPWKILTDMMEIERHWENEYENLDVREYTDLHMISGSLLYNWDKLPKTGIGLTRCKTDSGQVIVGRLINKFHIKDTLQSLGMRSNYKPAQIAKMLQEVKKGASIDLDKKWIIDLPQGSTNYRLDIPVEEQTGPTRNILNRIGVIPITTPLGMEYEIEPEKAIEIIQQLAVGSDLNVRNIHNNGPNNNGNVALAAMYSFKV